MCVLIGNVELQELNGSYGRYSATLIRKIRNSTENQAYLVNNLI